MEMMRSQQSFLHACVWILLNILMFHSPLLSGTVSFTANGNWDKAYDLESTCNKHYMCTPRKLTWYPSYESKFYDNVTACEALQRKGVTKIYFHGDSYMRQIYAALLITLNGDYRYGSIADPTQSPHCEYQRQFWEKACGTRQLNHYGRVCGNSIILDPLLNGFNKLDHCKQEQGSVVLWSFGNHRLTYGRIGINNASLHQELFERDICPALRAKQTRFNGGITGKACSVWWISTHFRMKAFFVDEQAHLVHQYNVDMRQHFDSGACGNVNYVDVYNMTRQLARKHSSEAEQMTYDGVHWGMEVNLVKAQIIINALVSAE